MARHFATTFSDARGRFLGACIRAGASVSDHHHHLAGPQGELLAADVARVGPADAEEVVLLVSATHGAEGYCGSGIQTGLLLEPELVAMQAGQALVMLHALNPYGFAWMRRVNENNIDLNRNFVDHAGSNYPENDLFELLAPHVVPRHWTEEARAAGAAAIATLAAKHGEVVVRKAIAKGQYRHPDNVHFGGTSPSWSNQLLHEVCARHLNGAKRAMLIDIHTGLGQYGYGELMTPSMPGEHVYDTLHAAFGDEVLSTTAGPTPYAGSKGSILAGFRPEAPGTDFVAVGLEYGTRARPVVREAVEADTWLHCYGRIDSDEGRAIKARLRDAFYPEEDEWKRHVWDRGVDVVGRAFAHLRDVRT